MATQNEFQKILSNNVRKWGTSYGSSRNSNVKLSIYGKFESNFSDDIGAQDSAAVSSGMLAGKFVIEMKSNINLYMKGKDGAAKLEGHLKSADFFDVAVYPTAKFVITKVEENEGKLAVTGNLNIKDVTKSITIPATLSEVDGVHVFKSENFNINRADFNVKYGSKSFFDNLKDKFIDDLVEMSFEVKTTK